MRTIIVTIDDTGRTQVNIAPDKNGRFLTKRDLDNSIRAIKIKYRQSVKEHRKKKIIEEYEKNKERIVENGKEDSKKENIASESDGSKGQDNTGVTSVTESSPGSSYNLARAVAAKEARRRGVESGKQGDEDTARAGKVERGSGSSKAS